MPGQDQLAFLNLTKSAWEMIVGSTVAVLVAAWSWIGEHNSSIASLISIASFVIVFDGWRSAKRRQAAQQTQGESDA